MQKNNPHVDMAKQDLNALDVKLKTARETSIIAPQPKIKNDHSAYNLGMKMAVELAAGLGFGIIIGYAIDAQFNSKPIGIITGALLGVAGGIWNVFRLTKMTQNKI